MVWYQLFHIKFMGVVILIQVIVFSAILVILLLILNSFLNYICGVNTSGNHGKVLEGALTIAILYFVIISLFGNHLISDGIPFIDQLDYYSSLSIMFREKPTVFVFECAELISLTFIISLISSYIPSGFGGNGITGTVIRGIVLVLIGVIVNNYIISLVKESALFSWALTAIQCFFSGTAMVLTPAIIIGKILQLDPKSEVVSFLVKKLPQTKVGKSMSAATSNAILFVLVILIFESQFGNISDFISQVPMLISLVAPIFIMLIGIRLMIKSVTK